MDDTFIDQYVEMIQHFKTEASKATGIPRDLMGFDKEPPRWWIEERMHTQHQRLLAKHIERRKTQLWLESLDVRPWWAVQLY